MTIGPQHLAVIRAETIVSIAINALVPTAIIRTIGLAPPATLLGPGQLVQGMSMASGLATFAMTLVVTLLVRGRVRKRPDLALTRAQVPAFVRWLPQPLALRMPVMGLVATLLLVPVGAPAATLLNILPLEPGGFILFNLAFGALVGLVMTPVVVLRAFANPVAAATGAERPYGA